MKKRKKLIQVFLGSVAILLAFGGVRTMTAKGEPDKNKISALSEQGLETLWQEPETEEDTTEYESSSDGEAGFGEPETGEADAETEAEPDPLWEPDNTLAQVTDMRSETGENETSQGADTGKTESSYDTGYIFLGDSRIYLMNEDCGIGKNANFFAVCCPGMGYDWMISEGLPKLKNIQKRHPEIENWVVISTLGINDMQNINKYISAYRKLAKSAELWLVSVNPTMGRMEPEYSNVCIEAFNRRLRKLTGVSYINSYAYLVKKGYDTKDGVHYTEASNWDIYSYILSSLVRGKDCAPAPDRDSKELAKELAELLSQGNH